MDIKLCNENEFVIVDDDEMELLLAERYLAKSRVPNPLLTFASGEAFLDYLNEVEAGKFRVPALVLMDVRMPTMDGFEVVERARRRPAFGRVPVIMMFSNSNAEADIRKAGEVGANGYQVKPSGGDEVIEFFNSLV